MPAHLPAAVAETHISVILFDGDRAYKRYKQLRTAFLDHTTVEHRRVDAQREVELNRRLAPDVYLGVAEVRDPESEVCDHLVVMARLDPARRLATLALAGGGLAEVDAVAQRIATFHRTADRSREISAVATPEELSARWDADLAETAATAAGAAHRRRIDRLRALAHRFVAARRPLLTERVEGGHICDGQGDLLADDIFCLDDGPRILDCLAFDDRLRWGDVIADIAFLAMDLEDLGRPDLGDAFLRAYAQSSGAHHPGSLADFYIAQRALVRAKVHALRADQPERDDRGAADDRAGVARLLELSEAHLQRAEARVVLVGGSPGTGKSTVARQLADRTGWALLRSDEVRKQALGRGRLDHAVAAVGEGAYTPETTDRVYVTMLDEARGIVGAGGSVVLDASWREQRQRDLAYAAARTISARISAVWCRAPVDVCQARVRERWQRGDDPSDATAEVVDWAARAFEAWPDAVSIDTTSAVNDTMAAVTAALDPPTHEGEERRAEH